MRTVIGTAFALLLLLALPSPAKAFGPEGHTTVCEIAWLNMSERTRAEVTRLLRADGQFQTFTRTCNYPDTINDRSTEHYANYARSDATVAGPGCPPGRVCILHAIDADLGVLRSATASNRRKGKALKFIGHWFGDIHQPLHISYKDDVGGNSILATGECSRKLHGVWDGCIIRERLIGNAPRRFRTVREAASRLNAEITPAQKSEWQQSESWEWAAESYEIARRPETLYCTLNAGACWYEPGRRDLGNGEPREQAIDADYLDDAAPVIAERLKQAGIRLAHALNLTFDPASAG